MQIVIDIPNGLYNVFMECKEPHYLKSLGDAVRDGTPLPKGHGRLIDQNVFLKKLDEFWSERKGLSYMDIETVVCLMTPTIIPATKEGDGGMKRNSKKTDYRQGLEPWLNNKRKNKAYKKKQEAAAQARFEEAVELWDRLTKKDVEVRVEKQN